MPAPSNTTPETATAITALPYTVTLDVSEAPDGSGYISSCDSAQRRAVWFAYTAQAGDVYLGLTAYPSAAANYAPAVSLWTGALGALTQLQITGPGTDDQEFCDELSEVFWFMVPVTVGTTYYIQVVDTNSAEPIGADLVVRVERGAQEAAPAGSILITDDSDGFPAGILDAATGAFLQWVRLPAGEVGAVLPTGELCLQGGETAAGQKTVAFYTGALAHVVTVDLAPYAVSGVWTDGAATFYVLAASTDRKVFSFSASGVALQEWTLPAAVGAYVFGAVSRDGSTFYYGNTSTNTPIKAYDLTNSAALPDLHAGYANQLLVGTGTGYVSDDGRIWFVYRNTSQTHFLRGFDASGVEVANYTIPAPTATVNRWVGALDGDNAVWIWGPSSPPNRFQKLSLVDGSVLVTLPAVPVNGTSGSSFEGPFSISNSCPILLLMQPLDAPEGGGGGGGGDSEIEPCVSAPVSLACWSGGLAGTLGCVSGGGPSAGCWGAYDPSVQRVGLIGEGQP